MTNSETQTIYDHPLYYDILFSWDRSQEADFYESAFRAFGIDGSQRILEVACGTGRVGLVLAERGWNLTGLDISEPMLEFLRGRSQKLGLELHTECGDMVDFEFELDQPFGAAFTPLGSLLQLHTDERVESHLSAMAAALETGGIYVIDLGLAATMGVEAQTTDETWEQSLGEISVRAENDAVYVNDSGSRLVLAWSTGTHLRSVTSQWLVDRVDRVGEFTIESWHPESGRTADGVSQWSLDVRVEPPFVGRALVVLRRI